MLTAHDQRTDDWFDARLGCVTASRVADVLSKTKSGESSLRKDYRMQLVLERLTNERTETPMTHIMQRGVDLEPVARDRLSENLGLSIDESGFMLHQSVPWFGASPDGIILSEHAIVEIKCPTPTTHLACLLEDKVNPRYITQMQAQMSVTGASFGYFASYDDRFPWDHQLYVRKIQRDDDAIDAMTKEILLFLEEVERDVDAILSRA